ncbi:MAG: amidohydrolase family protein, partial [Candidatus Hodarchaeota archaeon]
MIYDICIRNGKIVDGTGNPWYSGDLFLANDKILAIGKLKDFSIQRTIDATGLVVAPGFIDAHSHSDTTTLVYRQMENNLMQGMTTVIAGQCGISLAPMSLERRQEIEKLFSSWLPQGIEFQITWTAFDEYLQEEEKAGLGVNVAHLVGHSAIRASAMGMDARAPTSDELEAMKILTRDSMEAGAFGLSTGLIYPPGIFSATEEIIELAKVAARYGGIYASHIRGEGKTLINAVEEAIVIGEKAAIPVQISHHKASTKAVWGKSIETLQIIENARKRGIDVTVDQYPYRAGATSLATLLPPWVHDGGREKLLERLQSPEMRKKIQIDIETGLPNWENLATSVGWEQVFVTYVKTTANKPIEGKSMIEIMETRGD